MCVLLQYPNPPSQLSLWEETEAARVVKCVISMTCRKPTTFGRELTNSFHMSGLGETRTRNLRGDRKALAVTTDAPPKPPVMNILVLKELELWFSVNGTKP